MNNYPAFICHGGLGDVYIQLLKIKNLDSWIMEFTRLDRFRGLSK